MSEYIPQTGDIILSDSNKTGARIVKFFMTAPTVWHWLYRKIRKTQEKVKYYHVAMVWNEDYIIEQQAKVQFDIINLVPEQRKGIMIIRYKALTDAEKSNLKSFSEKEIGRGYDVLNCFGKFFTWLTGVKLFARYVELPKAEICINRVAHWYKDVIGEKFGVKNHTELTTHKMYKYIKNHPELFEILYEK